MSYTNDSNNTCIYVLTTSVINTLHTDNSPFYSEMGIFTRLRHVKLGPRGKGKIAYPMSYSRSLEKLIVEPASRIPNPMLLTHENALYNFIPFFFFFFA